MHQEQGMWKDKNAPERAHSAVSFRGRGRGMWQRNWAREWNRPEISNSAVSFRGQAADHNSGIHPEIKKCIRCETAVSIPRPGRGSDRRIRPETSGPKRRFHSAARAADQTADSPKVVNPRRKPRQSPRAVFAQNQAHVCASADVSEHIRETNYTTLKANQIWSASVGIECILMPIMSWHYHRTRCNQFKQAWIKFMTLHPNA